MHWSCLDLIYVEFEIIIIYERTYLDENFIHPVLIAFVVSQIKEAYVFYLNGCREHFKKHLYLKKYNKARTYFLINIIHNIKALYDKRHFEHNIRIFIHLKQK